jgi:hypothetical protein
MSAMGEFERRAGAENARADDEDFAGFHVASRLNDSGIPQFRQDDTSGIWSGSMRND